jgi:hypothetical protein
MQILTTSQRADREFDEASKRLRAGRLRPDELARTVSRLRDLAGETADEVDRVEIEAAAESLRVLPEILEMDRVYGPLRSSHLVAEVERIVAWGWEELPSTEARIDRVHSALRRIDLLPKGSPAEEHVRRTQRVDLLDLLAALQAGRS